MQSLGIDNIIDLKASPISSPSTTILKRPRQEKQQRAVISVVKGRISDIERWTQLYAHVTVNGLLPSLPSTSIFFLFVFFFIFISSCIFQSLLAPSHLDWGNSSWYNQNQTNSTWTGTGRNGRKERTWRREKDREEKKKKWLFLSLIFSSTSPPVSIQTVTFTKRNKKKKSINSKALSSLFSLCARFPFRFYWLFQDPFDIVVVRKALGVR